MDVNTYGEMRYLQDFHSKGSLYIRVFFMGTKKILFMNKEKIYINKGVSFNKDYFTDLA